MWTGRSWATAHFRSAVLFRLMVFLWWNFWMPFTRETVREYCGVGNTCSHTSSQLATQNMPWRHSICCLFFMQQLYLELHTKRFGVVQWIPKGTRYQLIYIHMEHLNWCLKKNISGFGANVKENTVVHNSKSLKGLLDVFLNFDLVCGMTSDHIHHTRKGSQTDRDMVLAKLTSCVWLHTWSMTVLCSFQRSPLKCDQHKKNLLRKSSYAKCLDIELFSRQQKR